MFRENLHQVNNGVLKPMEQLIRHVVRTKYIKNHITQVIKSKFKMQRFNNNRLQGGGKTRSN